MGILIAKKYKTNMLLKLADHTYVECGTGRKAWSCWGGKAGGSEFNRGSGSTERANRIAEPNERAGITRYLIDGVCHQAANRILAPAGILVSAARGYGLSTAIFGVYGRSTFNLHSGIKGDLNDCVNDFTGINEGARRSSKPYGIDDELVMVSKAFYSHTKFETKNPVEAMTLNINSFLRNMKIQSQDRLSESDVEGLKLAKSRSEVMLSDLDLEMQLGMVEGREFVGRFIDMTERFQNDTANVLSSKKYELIFGVNRDERITLADPMVVNEIFGTGTSEIVYGAELRNP